MSGIRRLAIMLVSWLVLPQAARADFQWVGLWQVDSASAGTRFSGSDTGVSVSGGAVANSSISDQTNAITFHRDFRILNLPPGGTASFNVVMNMMGSYVKVLSGRLGFASAGLTIDGVQYPGVGSGTLSSQTGGAQFLFTANGVFGNGNLTEGLHRVSGTLSVSASTIPFPNPPPPGSFFTINATTNYTLGPVDQTVLPPDLSGPEPTSAALFGLGLLGLAAAGAHQHRRRPAAGSTGGQGRATTTNPEEREPPAY